jgi:hypothetical protein
MRLALFMHACMLCHRSAGRFWVVSCDDMSTKRKFYHWKINPQGCHGQTVVPARVETCWIGCIFFLYIRTFSHSIYVRPMDILFSALNIHNSSINLQGINDRSFDRSTTYARTYTTHGMQLIHACTHSNDSIDHLSPPNNLTTMARVSVFSWRRINRQCTPWSDRPSDQRVETTSTGCTILGH